MKSIKWDEWDKFTHPAHETLKQKHIVVSPGISTGKTYTMSEIEEMQVKLDDIINNRVEETKMKNIMWKARSVNYDHDDRRLELTLESAFVDRFDFTDLRDVAKYVENKVNFRPWLETTKTTYHPDRIIPEIKDIIFNGPATIVFWKDGTKTVVKAQEGEIVDYEKGMAMAIAKRMLGNKGSYYDTFTKYLPKEEAE